MLHQYDSVELDNRLKFIEKSVSIVAIDVRQLWPRAIRIVKVH